MWFVGVADDSVLDTVDTISLECVPVITPAGDVIVPSLTFDVCHCTSLVISPVAIRFCVSCCGSGDADDSHGKVDDSGGDDDDDDSSGKGSNDEDGGDCDDDRGSFQIGAGLYAVGRPVQKRNEEDGQIGTNQTLPLEREALFNRFFGKPAHGPPHVAGGASGPIGGCRNESRTDNPDLDLRHVFDRNNRKTDLI